MFDIVPEPLQPRHVVLCRRHYGSVIKLVTIGACSPRPGLAKLENWPSASSAATSKPFFLIDLQWHI